MTLHPLAKRALVLGSGLLALAVLIGAFGAHGLKNMVQPDKLVTFETGVRYHFYHGFAVLVLGLIQQSFQQLKLEVPHWSFFVGILLFSFNCYFYVLTDIKMFAMIVPVGGTLFILGWVVLMVKLLKLR
ncbi:MAG: DUF423 domain-containing protein [Bacteriovoracia bacterium]